MQDKELQLSLLSNLRLKSKVLAIFFGFVYVMQLISISAAYFCSEEFSRIIPLKMLLTLPMLMLAACLLEVYAIRYFKKMERQGGKVSRAFLFLVTFVELSFPTTILICVSVFLLPTGKFRPEDMLGSPPTYIYFLFILLAPFSLDRGLCIFAGLIAGAEYILYALCMVKNYDLPFTQTPNNVVKGFMMIICGIVAGLVSKKIKEAVVSSLRSKNDLIHRLDILVNEKTFEINKQKEEIVEKNKDITDSINYARRIQTAILPKQEFLNNYFPKHFVLYKPKDIVSGDFYWSGHHENKKIIAAVDCTGHGVPGAFMSMVGSSLLNEIIHEKEITKADKILNNLRERLIKTLQQTGAEGENRDGMDIALCVLEGNELEFAGANNPIYHLRGRELKEIKGDKQPIGIYTGNNKSFTSQKIQLEKGDRVYIFTDGFADQFGGPKGKKFMYKKFQDTLIGGVNLSISQQKDELNKVFEAWRGGNSQVDDVLVIGIEF
jgi:serine phosphatase RsbU (regulator of sigma subunit)